MGIKPLSKEELIRLLGLSDFTEVYEAADKVRRENVGDTVHLRAIIEFSNYCAKECRYCGLNCDMDITRYRMEPEEILETAKEAIDAGYRTIVLQSGEDPGFSLVELGEITEKIRREGASVTISCGELSFEQLTYLRNKGADRYLLKHETADPNLYKSLHPLSSLETRIDCLRNIKKLGYETGSGFMIGLPGQTLSTIAEDLLLLAEIPCDMAGIGPFIPHPKTTLAGANSGSTELTKRAVALARLLLPKANLPVTTALGVLSPKEREEAFSCGANVVMKKVTPDKYKYFYEIYPNPQGSTSIKEDRKILEEFITQLGRIPR